LRSAASLCNARAHSDGPNHRGEIDQHAIASCLDDPPAVFGNEWISGDPVFAQRPRRACFVEPHQPAVANHVSGEDRSKAADRGHLSRDGRLA